MKKRALFVACVAGTLAIGADRPLAIAAVVAYPMISFDGDCEVVCDDGPTWDCEAGEHDAFVSAFDTTHRRGSGAHVSASCFPGTCQVKHPGCTPGGIEEGGGELAAAEFEQLRIALQDEDAPALRKLLLARPSRISVNARRSAVQVVDCRGVVVAHLPISQAIADDFAADGATP